MRDDREDMDAGRTMDSRQRFDALQARFIDDPKAAVREAGSLVKETIDRLFDGEQDTDQLRHLMQGYRDLLERLDHHHDGEGVDRVRGDGEPVTTSARGRERDDRTTERDEGLEPPTR